MRTHSGLKLRRARPPCAGMATSSSSAKRKRPSTPVAPSDSPAARRSRGSSSGSAAAAAAPARAARQHLLDVREPTDGWSTSLRRGHEEGTFLDVTLVAGGCNIHAHKIVLIMHSPYLQGLLTSGLAESTQQDREIAMGDEHTDGGAVEEIVDCFYSGSMSVSTDTACGLIRAANLLQVGNVEQAASDYFVRSLDPSTAVVAMGFATDLGCARWQASRGLPALPGDELRRVPTGAELVRAAVCDCCSADRER